MSVSPLPLCAVIVPVFNKASTVARTIQSIKGQTIHNIEVVLVDDGSTDNSRDVITALIANDSRFRYVHQANKKVAAARNRGVLMETTAPFVCTLDADDAIAPTFLEVCLRALLADNSLGIAYTGLHYITPDGKEGLSDWPGQFDADAFVRGNNQVPTCNVARRQVWVRTGGQRSRYCQSGAGEEDAEMWLRAMSIGWRGQKVSDEGLFIYSVGSGYVSGNPNHKASDWRADKPWASDGQHPFASAATPANGIAHLVRQVDQPTVAIVIPCGPGHLPLLWDALDSVESQSFRRWECIVVDDGVSRGEVDEWLRLKDAFPSMHFTPTPKAGSGAGVARNIGATLARAPFLLFLDADDWLEPQALMQMVLTYQQNEPGTIIYSDYLGYAYIDSADELERLQRAGRLLAHDPASKQTVMRYFAAEYDCPRALAQPDPGGNFYIWNVVSSLVARQFHLDIGGFDEKMDSWEDWDYWLRLARAGKCFVRVAQPLLNYRFHTGGRRSAANPGESGDVGRELSGKLLTYMREKYGATAIGAVTERSTAMPGCRSCGAGSSPPPAPVNAFRSLNEGRVSKMSSNDMVTVQLNDRNVGEHLIVFQQVSYGYRSHGDRFKMQAAHARLDNRVVIIEEEVTRPLAMPTAVASLPAPEPVLGDFVWEPAPSIALARDFEVLQAMAAHPGGPVGHEGALGEPGHVEAPTKQIVIEPKVYNFASLWGINDDHAALLVAQGVRTLDGLQMLGASRLAKLLGVTDNVAKNILARVEKISS